MKSYASRDEIEAGIATAPGSLFTPESEIAVVAAALCAPDACDEAFDALLPEQFGNGLLGRLWGIAGRLFRAGSGCSPALIRDAIGADEAFEAWGGIGKLEDLAETGSVNGLAGHVEAVADRAGRRALRRVLDEIGDKVTDTASGSFNAVLSELEVKAAEVGRHGHGADHLLDAGTMISVAIDRAQLRRGRIDFPTGLKEVDQLMGGLNRGEVTIIGGWTGMGKTIGGLQIVKASASARLGSIYISLEMSDDPMALRLACDLSYTRMVDFHLGAGTSPTIDKALKGELTPHQWERMREAGAIAAEWPLKFEVRPGLTVAQIEAIARRQHRKWARQGIRPGPIVVDHIGKVRPAVNRRGDKTAETSDVSNALGEMAKRLDCPVVALTQLNRDVDKQGEDKRPNLAHIKQSSTIAEDARQVIFLYRPEYYFRQPMDHEDSLKKSERLENLKKVKNRLYWIVAKNSNGAPGQVLTFCEASASAVRDW